MATTPKDPDADPEIFAMSRHARRSTNIVSDVETTPFAHKYLVKRPVIKEQLTNVTSMSGGSLGTSMSLQHTRTGGGGGGGVGVTSEAGGEAGGGEGMGIDNPKVEKRRFELFIDLIWVGIIGNLAEHFSEQAFSTESRFTIGEAVGEFIILFLIAWRMWKNLDEFMNRYHTNDLVERLFVIWALILAMLYGNNGPYLLDESKADQSNIAIIIYLVSRFSYTTIEAIYSLWLPFQRRGLFLRFLVALPNVGIWMAAIWTSYPTKAGLLIAAVFLEFLVASLIDTPLFEQWLHEELAKPFDADHWVERIQDFFIIILGEGVLNLIKGSPLGKGITEQAGVGVLALVEYYLLSALYFNGDQSRRYVHAVKRTYWRKALWLFFHTVMFHSTLILGVSVVFLVQHPTNTARASPLPSDPTVEDTDAAALAHIMYSARWSVSVALTTTIACLSVIAILSRSLDRPGSLKVTNRHLRLLARVLLMAVVMCLPIGRGLMSITFLGIIVGLLSVVLMWEWFASLEKGGQIFEP